jgi:hypothetical protein
MPKAPMEKTKKLMAALLGMKPRHHEDMKLGKKKKRKKKEPSALAR